MKQLKTILSAAIIMLITGFAVIYTSCRKDACKGVNCLNSGVCSNGKCTCPAGYAGADCETFLCATVTCINRGTCSNGKCVCPTGYFGVTCENADTPSIVYHNNSFTPVNITVNGSSAVIAAGKSAAFKGAYGSIATGTAYTSGPKNSYGHTIGLTITWNLSDTFSGSTQSKNLDVSSDYFFFMLGVQDGPYYPETMYVNYGLPAQTLDTIEGAINPSSLYCNIGYYKASANSNIYLLCSTFAAWNSAVTLPFTANQAFYYTIY